MAEPQPQQSNYQARDFKLPIWRLIQEGRLSATNVSRDWLINKKDLKLVADSRSRWPKGRGSIPKTNPNISSYKNPCDIHLKHEFLTEFGLWRTPAPKSRQISFRFFGYHNVARTVVILNESPDSK
jgi:hypothetical protein